MPIIILSYIIIAFSLESLALSLLIRLLFELYNDKRSREKDKNHRQND